MEHLAGPAGFANNHSNLSIRFGWLTGFPWLVGWLIQFTRETNFNLHGKTIMSFKISNKNIKCKVTFKAEADLDEMVDVAIVIEYRRPTVEEGKQFSRLNAEFADAVKAMVGNESASVAETSDKVNGLEQKMSDFVRTRITGWADVQDGDGNPLPFNEDNLLLLFNDRDARRGVFSRYQQLITGRKEAEAAELKKSEATG